jgi:mono/diheme cytochrome c family protein
MIPWTTLTEKERWALVAHLKTLTPAFAEQSPTKPLEVPKPPAETAALSASGKTIYERAHCGDCHGASGHGDGAVGAALQDRAGNPVRPRDFSTGRFRRGTRLEEIFLSLRTGFDGTPMGSYATILSPEESWAVAAYIRTMVPKRRAGAQGMLCPTDGPRTDTEEQLGATIALSPAK